MTAFVSCWKPTSGALTSLATMRSRFLRCSLLCALATRSLVSAAKPTRIWPGHLRSPSAARMSGVGSSTMSGTPPSFLILPASATFGRKSATAAAITTTSACGARASTAACICAAVSTAWSSAPGGVGSTTVDTSVTRAPCASASAATAYPCLPLLRLAITRTASIGSRVPPAVTTTCVPCSAPPPSTSSTSARIRSGEASRPLPESPPARRPSSGSTTCTPRRRRVSMLSTTAGCSHISVCIAGQTITGARVANRTLVNRSVESPAAYAPISRAVAGTTSTRSADCPSFVCGIGVSSSHKLVCTGSLASADSVVMPRKCSAPLVITGMTCAPASTNRRQISTAL